MIELLLSLLGLILMAGVSFISLREIKRTRALIPSISDYIKKGEEGEYIIREDIGALLKVAGTTMFQSAKMSMLQGLGANAKLEKGLKGAMAQDILEEKMPLLNLAGDLLGFNTKQYLAKNPDLIMQLAPLAQKFLGGKGSFDLGSLMGGGQHSQPRGNDGVGYG